MKLRLRGNSIRLRLTQPEVRQIGDGGKIEETVNFGANQKFIYALETANSETISARFENNKIAVLLPKMQAANWANSDEISLEAGQEIDDGETLKILVEKDFVCLTRRDGDEEDENAFPHPLEKC